MKCVLINQSYFNGSEGKHDLASAINVGVQNTQDVLKLLRNHQTLQLQEIVYKITMFIIAEN